MRSKTRPRSPVLLYDNPVSGNCYKVRLLLTLLGVEFERRELSVVDRSDRGEVLGGLSPSLNVPTVVLEDGRPLAESNAILWYFADGTPYLPDEPYERAQVERHLAERTHLVAERFTIADIALYAYTHVAPEAGFDLDPYPAVRAWLDRIATQPEVIPITA